MDKKKYQQEFVERVRGITFLEKFFNAFPDTHFFIKDIDHKHVMVNRLLTVGKNIRKPSDVIGKTAAEFCPPDWVKKYEVDDNYVIQTGNPIINREEKVLTQDGLKWFSTTKIPLFDNEGVVIGLIGITRNIEQYKYLVRKIGRQNKKLEMLSKMDSLTNCYNQRYLQEDLVYRLSDMRRMNTGKFCLLSFDLDNFKKINDTYGHLVGDKVLIRFCKEIRKVIKRKTDSFIRQGGDEFLLALFGTNKTDGIRIAKNIIETIRKISWPRSYFKGKKYQLTTSIGVSTYAKGDSLENLIHRADEALYKAKGKGKNRIEFG